MECTTERRQHGGGKNSNLTQGDLQLIEYILKNTIVADTRTRILTSGETKYVSKATQLHKEISYFKIHLSLFLAKSITASNQRLLRATLWYVTILLSGVLCVFWN